MLLLLTFLCISAVSVYAQREPNSVTGASPTPLVTAQDTVDELKSQQQLVAELKFLRKENAALKDEIAAKKGELAVQERITKIEVERGDFYKSAAEKGIKVGDNSVVLSLKYEQQIAMFKDENNRLRDENKDLRNSRNVRTFLGLGVGAGLGYGFCRR